MGMAAARTWMNAEGRVIEAEMLGSDDNEVSLKLPDGKIVSVAISSLGAMDQAFVRKQAEAAARVVPVEKRVWPETVQVPQAEIEKVELVPDTGEGFVYRSRSFEFSSAVKLLPSLIREVARTFEATKRLLTALPWGIECKPPEGMERYLAALHETRASYLAAGGLENSSGIYLTKEKIFRIPFESLGIRKLGQSYTRDSDFVNDTLIHEITHQLMHDYLPFLPQWAVEGTAEFTEMMPYKAGTFRVGSHEKGLKEYLGGRRSTAKLPHLKDLFRMTRAEWDKQSQSVATQIGQKSRQAELYEQSALLVYYFNFLDGDGPQRGHRWLRYLDAVRGEVVKWKEYDKSVAAFLIMQDEFLKLPGVRKLEDGRIEYPSKLTPPLPPVSPEGIGREYNEQTPFKYLGVLLDGRSEEEVERDMASKFTAIDVKIGF